MISLRNVLFCILSLSVASLHTSDRASSGCLLLKTIPYTEDDKKQGNYAELSVNDGRIRYHFPPEMKNIHMFMKDNNPDTVSFKIKYSFTGENNDMICTAYLESLDKKSQLPLLPRDAQSTENFFKLMFEFTRNRK